MDRSNRRCKKNHGVSAVGFFLMTGLIFACGSAAAEPPSSAAAEPPSPESQETPTLRGEAPFSLGQVTALPKITAQAGNFHLTLTATPTDENSSGGDFEVSPGMEPGDEGSTFIFSDGFESGNTDHWSSVVGSLTTPKPRVHS